ncbi:hypothetical protein GEO21_21890 [Sphingobacterium faecium]|uniref:hypothetical protein n=1 Tax=Sphingobacterium faecium TaxID=34087 RepID=UPI001290EC52|nr:hypothetical protein [Sphingobacterium faecium]MQP30139.1 hypothetical protein [Sphingobacterium faecium]
MKMRNLFIVFFSLVISSATAQTNTFPPTGNVGIGTTTPQYKLEINGGLAVNGRNPVNGINNFVNTIQINNASNGAIVFNPGLETQQMFGFHANGSMYWGGQSTYSMILSNAGHLRVTNSLSIGSTLKAGDKLSVKGKISAQEVQVTTTNWPDYVFEENYSLRPILEIEQFVKSHKHLPEIPPAKQIEAEGIALGEMNKLLLKKVEELTLYIIQEKKANAEYLLKLEKRIEMMEERK